MSEYEGDGVFLNACASHSHNVNPQRTCYLFHTARHWEFLRKNGHPLLSCTRSQTPLV